MTVAFYVLAGIGAVTVAIIVAAANGRLGLGS